MSLKKQKRNNNLQFDLKEIRKVIETNKDAKIYLGCDSVKVRRKKLRFATVVCIHYNGNNGVKVFGEITYEKAIKEDDSKPINKMLAEVNKVIELYNRLEDVLIHRINDVEIHLDINPNENEGSYVAHGAAKGIVEGMVGIMPIFKPFAFASTCAADKFCNLKFA